MPDKDRGEEETSSRNSDSDRDSRGNNCETEEQEHLQEEGAAGEEKKERPVVEGLSGCLLQLKNKPSSFSSWDNRYLSIDPSKEIINFFSSEKDRNQQPLQSIPLANVSKVQSVDQNSFQIIVKGKPETVVFLRATSPEEKMRWVHHLDLFIAELTAYERWMLLSKEARKPTIEPREGYLLKLKRNPPSIGSSWNKRYFRVNTSQCTLDYFNKKPKEGTEPKDKRTINLSKLVDIRSIDPWTIQLEVKEETESSSDAENLGEKNLIKKQRSTLQSGNISFYCLQAKSQEEHSEWKSLLENFFVDNALYHDCKLLGRS